MIKVGINGFGRIGRLALRIIMQKHSKTLQPVLVNTSGKIDTKGWAHLFKYDSAYGKFPGTIEVKDDFMIVNGLKIKVTGERDPVNIPWNDFGAQVIIESTGKFLTEIDAKLHIKGSVKKVILSAPAKEGDIPLYVIGVNADKMGDEPIISCASCTTNCLAPVAQVMDKSFGVEKALMSTIHAYTSDQELLDGSHKDLRRARSAAVNIIPTTTGAAKATGKVYPDLKGKFDGIALRVPTITGSLVDCVFVTKKDVTKDEVNKAFIQAAKTSLKGILSVTDESLVSTDIVGTEYSAIVDLSLTNVMDGNLVKVIAWYDNEWGYTNRLVEEVVLLGEKLS